MKETFKNLIHFFKSPNLQVDQTTSLKNRFKIFFQILVICILTGIIISPIFAVIEKLKWVNMDTHKVEALFKNMSKFQVILLGAILIPIIEEVIFRGPITLFKNPKYFKFAFYFFTLLFGFVHITNFNITTNVLLLSLLLVLPQIFLGGYFGYIRVRFGIQWSMLLHGTYNCFFILISFIFK